MSGVPCHCNSSGGLKHDYVPVAGDCEIRCIFAFSMKESNENRFPKQKRDVGAISNGDFYVEQGSYFLVVIVRSEGGV
jgi:hypothetical protein